MKLFSANLKIILDSRGQETLGAELSGRDAEQRGIVVESSVPAGKSRGTHEAFVLEPKLALEKFEEIKTQILNREFQEQKEFDDFLINFDGTPNKQNLGGNLILALSLAWARLKAKSEGKELFNYIRSIAQLPITNYQLPHPIFNVINGGAHATHPESKLDFQEFQIIPEVKDFGMALGLGQEFYEKLGQFLEKKFGKENILLGDEAGFSAPFKNNEEAIETLAELIEKYKYPLRIGLDVAASQFYQQPTTNDKQQGFYLIGEKKYSAEELRDLYLRLIEAYNILSIEDPFYEEAFDDFAELTQNLTQNRRGTLQSKEVRLPNIDGNFGKSDFQKFIITDDLTTTNPERLKTAINKKSGNAILIKSNQIGTLTETLKVVKMAYENNWQAVVSHRSGETMDDFIADLAVGIGAWGIKAGAPAKPERMAKYQRLLKIFNAF